MKHHDLILDQFTRQAVPFSDSPSIRDPAAIDKLVTLTDAAPTDRTLDVACGPGLVTLAYALRVAHAEGIDATPAMLDRARELQRDRRIENVTWHEGDAGSLPFDDMAFDIVTCRFAIHHLLDPARVLAEMIRVTKRGGRVAIVDGYASADPRKAEAFNAMERIRDPSTVRFHTVSELRDLLARVHLTAPTEYLYRLPAELEGLMRTSFPDARNVQLLRDTIRNAVSDDALGMGTRIENGLCLFEYPIAMFVHQRS